MTSLLFQRSFFTTTWIVGFSFLNQCVFMFLPGKLPLEFRLCSGVKQLEEGQTKINFSLITTSLLTILINTILPAAIYFLRFKGKMQEITFSYKKAQTLAMYSCTTTLFSGIITILNAGTQFISYKINQDRINLPRFHNLTHIIQMVLPQLSHFLVVMCYFLSNSSLRKGLPKAIYENIW